MVTEASAAEKFARRMLAQYGMPFIWDTHVAAAAAYGLGNIAVAERLSEIAEAAEQEWLQPSVRKRTGRAAVSSWR